MNNPFLSIVIPVYNGLTHDLPRCLDSIWNQPLETSLYEVICIDDCSTDDTRQWLAEQKHLHNNLQIVENKHNMRQGGGRNKGIKVAKGRYIAFIDQDDYYHQGAVAEVYNHLKQRTDLEVLVVDCTYEHPGCVNNTLQHNFPHREVMTGDELIGCNSIPYAPWKFIFQRRLVTDHDLWFNENERIEDIDWVHRLVHQAKRAQYQPILFIHYQKTTVSTTMTAFHSPETMHSGVRCAHRIYNLIDNEFAQSPVGARTQLVWLSGSVYHNALRNFLFCKDTVQAKTDTIRQHVVVTPQASQLTRFAYSYPYAFSRISNITSLFLPAMLTLYRRWKYRH